MRENYAGPWLPRGSAELPAANAVEIEGRHVGDRRLVAQRLHEVREMVRLLKYGCALP
jgi:hypothetical protein